VGLKSLKSLNLTNVYPNSNNKNKNNNNKKKNNKVKSKPLELRSRVKSSLFCFLGSPTFVRTSKKKIRVDISGILEKLVNLF
jgi:hypothetical protein